MGHKPRAATAMRLTRPPGWTPSACHQARSPQRHRPLAGVSSSPCNWPHALGACRRSGCCFPAEPRHPRHYAGSNRLALPWRRRPILRGWQRTAAHVCDERALETRLADLSTASRALLLSQEGPHSARVLIVAITEDVTIPWSHNLAHGPAPVEVHWMNTATTLCPRLCQEAGARVGRNVAFWPYELGCADPRRPAQLAVDATLVSPVSHDGNPHPDTRSACTRLRHACRPSAPLRCSSGSLAGAECRRKPKGEPCSPPSA